MQTIKFSKLLAAFISALCIVASAHDASTIFNNTKNSIYLVSAISDAASSQGSAVRIGANSVVTNCHVIQGASKISLITGAAVIPASLLHSDPSRDLCTLFAGDLPPSNWPAIRPLDGIKVGERVFALGNPRALDLTLSEGIVAAIRKTESGTFIQNTAPISPGSSGGALLDTQGRLLGITSFQRIDSQNLNFAAPAEWIAEVSARNKPLPELAESKKKTRHFRCIGRVETNNPILFAIKKSSVWAETIDIELDTSPPSIKIPGFSPTLLDIRAKGFMWEALALRERPYVLMEYGDKFFHTDSEKKTDRDSLQITSIRIDLDRKSAELTLTDTQTTLVYSTFHNSEIRTTGKYNCEPDKERLF